MKEFLVVQIYSKTFKVEADTANEAKLLCQNGYGEFVDERPVPRLHTFEMGEEPPLELEA